jgi:hypothetical protein
LIDENHTCAVHHCSLYDFQRRKCSLADKTQMTGHTSSGVAALIGGEVNSEIESAAARESAPEAKEKGEKSSQGRLERAKAA